MMFKLLLITVLALLAVSAAPREQSDSPGNCKGDSGACPIPVTREEDPCFMDETACTEEQRQKRSSERQDAIEKFTAANAAELHRLVGVLRESLKGMAEEDKNAIIDNFVTNFHAEYNKQVLRMATQMPA